MEVIRPVSFVCAICACDQQPAGLRSVAREGFRTYVTYTSLQD